MIIKHQLKTSRVVLGTWKVLLNASVTSLIAYLINDLWLSYYFDFPVFVPTVLGTALAFFIGFNNNQAYDRWWEGRKIWGALVNDSRTWSRQILQYTRSTPTLGQDELDAIKSTMVKRHIAFLYALKANLRLSQDLDYQNYLSKEDLLAIATQTNIHNAILSLQSRDVAYLYHHQAIDGFKFMELNKMITSFCDEMGKSERIKNTVFPTTYNYFSKAFIWVFIYSATMSIGVSIGIWAVIFGTLLGYVFFTIQSIGQALLNPFENQISGVPLDSITRTIEINVLEMLGEVDLPDPVPIIDDEYIM